MAVTVLVDASRAVNVHPHDAEKVTEGMVPAGAYLAKRKPVTVGRAGETATGGGR